MHPRFEVEREYAVRVQGSMTEEQMKLMLNDGILLEDGPVKFEKLLDEGGEGYNHWYRLIMKEGRNRVVRRTFEALGLPVSRLMRVRFGMINLPPRLKRGMLAELGPGEVKMILEWVGIQIPLNLPQVSPDQHNNKRLERKPIPKSTRSGKQEDKSGETHKAKQRNDAPAALRNKSSVSRMKTGKQR
jgi:23S rRNA pseudouridine2605 synthase